jgi:hypothetical protein
MNDVLPSPVRVEVAGGFVDSTQRGRAQALIGSVSRSSRRVRGRVVLFAPPDVVASAASADAILVLDDYRLICAGAVGASVLEAIEKLEARLHRQLAELGERERNLHRFIRHGGRTPPRSRRRRREPAETTAVHVGAWLR